MVKFKKKLNRYTSKNNNQSGYIALIMVLIIGAVALILVLAANFSTISQAQIGIITNKAAQNYYLATACAEYAIIKLQNDLNYAGNEDITIDGQICHIDPIEGVGNINRVIKTISNEDGYTKKIKIEIDQVIPQTKVKFWQEVADF